MSDEKTNKLATIDMTRGGGLVISNVAELNTVAQIIRQAGIAPSSLDTNEKICVALMAGGELGLKPIQSVNSIYIVKGKPTLWGDMALALVRKSDLLEEFDEHIEGKGDERVAVCYSKRKGDKKGKRTEYSVEDAKEAKLWNKQGSWQTGKSRMMQYKARAFNLRDQFTDVLNGMHLTEEMEGEDQLNALPVSEVKPRATRRQVVSAEVIKDEPPSPSTDEGKEAVGGGNPVLADRVHAGMEDVIDKLKSGKSLDVDTVTVDEDTGEILSEVSHYADPKAGKGLFTQKEPVEAELVNAEQIAIDAVNEEKEQAEKYDAPEEVTLAEVQELFDITDHGSCELSEFVEFVLMDDIAPGDLTVENLEYIVSELQTSGVPAELKGE